MSGFGAFEPPPDTALGSPGIPVRWWVAFLILIPFAVLSIAGLAWSR